MLWEGGGGGGGSYAIVALSLSEFGFSRVDSEGHTVGDKIKFPLCTDSPPTCEWCCQQNSPKSRPTVASDFRCTLIVIKKVADLFLSGEKIVWAHIQFRPKSQTCANGTRRKCNFAYYRALLHSLSPFDVACRCLLR